MEPIIGKIVEKLDDYERKLTSKKCGYSLTRRGLCGEININTVFKELKTDFKLEKIDKSRNNNIIDIYKLPTKNIYFKRLCICDKPCGIESMCSNLKTKKSCDGHHAIIVSSNDSIDIDTENDYVIDFTYKQMLYESEHSSKLQQHKENYQPNIDILQKMPGYLFMVYNDYLKSGGNQSQLSGNKQDDIAMMLDFLQEN